MDTVTFVTAGVMFAIVATMAIYVPARRAWPSIVALRMK